MNSDFYNSYKYIIKKLINCNENLSCKDKKIYIETFKRKSTS